MLHQSVSLHRLFFGLQLAPQAAHRADLLADQHAPADAQRVRKDRLHMTLAIFGDEPQRPEKLIGILREIGASLKTESFTVRLDVLSGNYGCVVLRPRLKIEPLQAMQKQIVAACGGRGLHLQEGWEFHPHVTLFYRAGRPFTERITPISWTVNELVLIESLVGQTRHNELGRWRLAETPRQGSLF